ncbi:hypothetical protein PENSPDRAFT_483261 [Peniophora sp. CONT]|nr:hypothetical protein PENSPDRAFT_483261 [Peniophora sp. CONT]
MHAHDGSCMNTCRSSSPSATRVKATRAPTFDPKPVLVGLSSCSGSFVALADAVRLLYRTAAPHCVARCTFLIIEQPCCSHKLRTSRLKLLQVCRSSSSAQPVDVHVAFFAPQVRRAWIRIFQSKDPGSLRRVLYRCVAPAYDSWTCDDACISVFRLPAAH